MFGFFQGLITWYLLRGWAYRSVEGAMLGEGSVCASIVSRESLAYRNGFRRYLISSESGVDHGFTYRARSIERRGEKAAARWGLRLMTSPVHFVAGGAAAFMWQLKR